MICFQGNYFIKVDIKTYPWVMSYYDMIKDGRWFPKKISAGKCTKKALTYLTNSKYLPLHLKVWIVHFLFLIESQAWYSLYDWPSKFQMECFPSPDRKWSKITINPAVTFFNSNSNRWDLHSWDKLCNKVTFRIILFYGFINFLAGNCVNNLTWGLMRVQRP